MSLEYALEKFPINITLKDGLECLVRPLAQEDAAIFQEFYLSIPEHERLFIKLRLTDRSVFHQWCAELNYQMNLPLLMIQRGKVIGDCTLHQRPGGWKRHIGLISILVHPDYRGRGVSRILVEEMIAVARHCGLKRLETELTGDRKIALHSFAQLGFRQLVRLPNYVEDMQRNPYEYVLMGRDLITDEEYAAAG